MKQERKLIREALPFYNAKRITITEVKGPITVPTLEIQLPFTMRDGTNVTIFAYQKPPGKKLYFTDAGRVIRSLKTLKVGIVMPVLQTIFKDFGLYIDEMGSIIDDSNRTLGERLKSFIEAYLAVDGIARGWVATEEWKKEIANAKTIQSTG